MKPSIIFLDDDQRFLDGLRRALNKYKNEWDMTFVTEGEAAFRQLEGRRVHILVSDHDMPGMMGDTVMETVRHRWPATVRVMLTGRPLQTVAAALMGVAHRSFSKPCDVDQLALYLSRVLASARAFKTPLVVDLVSGLSMPPLPRSILLAAREEQLEPGVQIAAALFQLATSHLSAESGLGAVDDHSLRLALDQLRQVARDRLPQIENPIVLALWQESVEIARTVQRMAKAAHLSASKQRELTITGPFSNIGSIALAEVLPGTYAIDVGTAGTPERWAMEKAAFGASGLEVGAFLLTAWGFPEGIVDEVRSQGVTIATMGNHPREVRVLAGARDRSWPELVEIEKQLAV